MKTREIIKVKPEQGREMIDGASNFEIVYDKLSAQSRWDTEHEIVLKRIGDGKFFISYYTVGSTEQQKTIPYEHDKEAIFQEVVPTKKTIIAYEWPHSKK